MPRSDLRRVPAPALIPLTAAVSPPRARARFLFIIFFSQANCTNLQLVSIESFKRKLLLQISRRPPDPRQLPLIGGEVGALAAGGFSLSFST